MGKEKNPLPFRLCVTALGDIGVYRTDGVREKIAFLEGCFFVPYFFRLVQKRLLYENGGVGGYAR